MEIIERRDAIDRQLCRYFTGKPCKRGHISERYTRISACIECLHPSFEAKEIRERKETRERLTRKLQAMMQINVRLHPNDVELFEAMVLAAAMAHEPLVSMGHLKTRAVPKYWGGSMFRHTYRCFPDDERTLRGLQDDLERARMPSVVVTDQSIATAAQERLSAVLAAADAEASKRIPEFRP